MSGAEPAPASDDSERTVGDASGAPLVFVTVGTDVHRFERLIDWVERWAATEDAAGLEVVVQHGTSRAPTGVTAAELLPLPEVLDLMRRATVVVAQGGPGGILDSRDCGRMPIVVPRRHDLGEHVDDHQLAFTARLARDGHIRRVETEEEFRTAIASVLADPESVRLPPSDTGVAPAVESFGTAVEDLLMRRGRRQ